MIQELARGDVIGATKNIEIKFVCKFNAKLSMASVAKSGWKIIKQ